MRSQSESRTPLRFLALLPASIMAHCGGPSSNAGTASDLPTGASQGNQAGRDASGGSAPSMPDDAALPQEGGAGMAVDATRVPPPVVDDAGNPLPLFAADSSPVRASDCKPGTYAGPFDTMVTFMGGGDASVFEWTGMLSITLVANSSTPQFGEFNSTVLTVAPGAHISGTDTIGGMFDAQISGQLDCASRMFVGTIVNGTYTGIGVIFTGSTSVMMVGSLSATYDPNANPVALTNGAMTVGSPQIATIQASGSWSAVHQ